MEPYTGDMPFETNEALLAFCLFTSGCDPCDERTPCINLYDEEILFRIGGGEKDHIGKTIRPSKFAGMSLWDAAQRAWKDEAKGDVKFCLRLTARCSELIRAYREQCKQIDQSEEKASTLLLGIAEQFKNGAIQADEFILRTACVNLKTRRDFMNHWKKTVPMLRVPRKGKSTMVDSTVSVYNKGGGTKSVPAKVVTSPGFDVIGLNASDSIKKEMGLL
jgi:hypothetical protein